MASRDTRAPVAATRARARAASSARTGSGTSREVMAGMHAFSSAAAGLLPAAGLAQTRAAWVGQSRWYGLGPGTQVTEWPAA